VKDLEALYPRKFTPDGHLVGSIGEVVAAEALGLTLYPMSRAGHDAYDANGDVQIKMTAGRSVAMYAESIRLVVLRVLSAHSGDHERSIRSIMNTESGDHERLLAVA
jgi:hypothetical protein